MCRAVTVISTHHAVKAGTKACNIEPSGCPGTWDSRSASPVPTRLLHCMGWEEGAVGGCSRACTKIGSQPPASPARLPTIPPCHRGSGKTPTSRRGCQDQQHPCCCPRRRCWSSIPPLLPVLLNSPLLPSRRNDNNSRAPLPPSAYPRFNNNHSSLVSGTLRCIDDHINPSLPSQHANRISIHAHNKPASPPTTGTEVDKQQLRARRRQSGPVRRRQPRASRPNSTRTELLPTNCPCLGLGRGHLAADIIARTTTSCRRLEPGRAHYARYSLSANGWA